MAKNGKTAGDKTAKAMRAGKDHQNPKTAPDKIAMNPQEDDQGRHGSGEGVSGMQPGAGHPHGR